MRGCFTDGTKAANESKRLTSKRDNWQIKIDYLSYFGFWCWGEMKKENCQLILIQHWKPKEKSRQFLCIIVTCQYVAWKVALILSCSVQISVPLNFSCVWILFQNVSNQPCYRLGWFNLGYFFDSFLCYYIAFMWFVCASWHCNFR